MIRFESKEDYLERILVLSDKNEKLRAIVIAKEDACKIEHDISHETFIKLKEFIERGK